MDSRIWRSWLVLGLMTAALVACGDNNSSEGDGGESEMPYSGVWVSKSYSDMYKIYQGAKKQRRFRVEEFCARDWYDFHVPAILVDKDGHTYWYHADDNADSEYYRNRNYMGQVERDGRFYNGSYLGRNQRDFAPWTWRSRSTMDVDRDTLVVYKRKRGGRLAQAETFVRTNKSDLLKMQRVMDLPCMAGEDEDSDGRVQRRFHRSQPQEEFESLK